MMTSSSTGKVRLLAASRGPALATEPVIDPACPGVLGAKNNEHKLLHYILHNSYFLKRRILVRNV